MRTELNRYDAPLVGIIEQDGALHFFECGVGAGAPLSVWWYCTITEGEAAALEAVDVEGLSNLVGELLRSRRCALALAVEDEGIMAVTHVEDFRAAGDGIAELLGRFDAYRKKLDRAGASEAGLLAQAQALLPA